MPETAQQKLEVYAKELAESVGSVSGVELVTLMGSVAIGVADDYSDIDLLAFYSTEPSLEEIHLALQKTGTKAEKFWMDSEKFTIPFSFNSVSGAVVFMKRGWYQNEIEKYPDVTLEEYKQLAHCITEAKYMAGDRELYDVWKNKIGTIPAKLKELTLNARIAALRNFFVEKRILPNIFRSDWLFIDHLFAQGVDWALEVVYLLNDSIYASPKLARKKLEKMQIQPANFIDRLEKITEGTCTEESLKHRVGAMSDLVTELIQLVENRNK